VVVVDVARAGAVGTGDALDLAGRPQRVLARHAHHGVAMTAAAAADAGAKRLGLECRRVVSDGDHPAVRIGDADQFAGVVAIGPHLPQHIGDGGEQAVAVAVLHAPRGGLAVVAHGYQPIIAIVLVPEHLAAVVVEHTAAPARRVVLEGDLDVVAVTVRHHPAISVVVDPVALAILPAKAFLFRLLHDLPALVEGEHQPGTAAAADLEAVAILVANDALDRAVQRVVLDQQRVPGAVEVPAALIPGPLCSHLAA